MLGIVAGSLKCEVEKAFEEESMQLVNNLQAVVKNEFSPSVRWAIFDLQAGVGWQSRTGLTSVRPRDWSRPHRRCRTFSFSQNAYRATGIGIGRSHPPCHLPPPFSSCWLGARETHSRVKKEHAKTTMDVGIATKLIGTHNQSIIITLFRPITVFLRD